MSSKPLVVFTPSGKRGHFEKGTSILQIARQLGVDLDSVCGGRGICSKCQITPSYGKFTKHGVTVAADALSEWNKVEERYNEKRGLAKGRRLGCQACVQGDVVIDVPDFQQAHRLQHLLARKPDTLIAFLLQGLVFHDTVLQLCSTRKAHQQTR